jgi:hypothetical protein
MMKVSLSVPRLDQLAAPGGHPVVIIADGRRLETPPVESLAFYVALGGLAAAEIIEWPVALALTAGHILVGLTHRPGLQAAGEAFAEA